jgi:hypothetical protein
MPISPCITPAFIQRHRDRLAYGSFVADNGKFLYLETPKAACSTMKQLLMELAGRPLAKSGALTVERVKHLDAHHKKIHQFKSLVDLGPQGASSLLASPDMVRFCVVRNPYARLVSAWSNKILERNHAYVKLWGQINAHHRIEDPNHCPSFREFVQWLDVQGAPEVWDSHWRSMCALLLPDTIAYTQVLKTETLAADVQTLLARIQPGADAQDLLARNSVNHSLPRDWQAEYADDTAAIVARHYADDFKTFGYDTESWRISGARQAAMQTAQYWQDRHAEMAEKALAIIRDKNDAHALSLAHGEALLNIISGLTRKRVV